MDYKLSESAEAPSRRTVAMKPDRTANGNVALSEKGRESLKASRQKSELEENIAANMKERVLPSLAKLKKTRLSAEQKQLISILESNLHEITSFAVRKLQICGLTQMQIAVASLLREGRNTAEIAKLLGISLRAVEFHRYNIRKKLALDPKTNLRAHLLTIA